MQQSVHRSHRSTRTYWYQVPTNYPTSRQDFHLLSQHPQHELYERWDVLLDGTESCGSILWDKPCWSTTLNLELLNRVIGAWAQAPSSLLRMIYMTVATSIYSRGFAANSDRPRREIVLKTSSKCDLALGNDQQKAYLVQKAAQTGQWRRRYEVYPPRQQPTPSEQKQHACTYVCMYIYMYGMHVRMYENNTFNTTNHKKPRHDCDDYQESNRFDVCSTSCTYVFTDMTSKGNESHSERHDWLL
jgi:hypothetical protein